jgi:hypothetical protein
MRNSLLASTAIAFLSISIHGKSAPLPIANPYRFKVASDVLTKAIAELMRDRKLILDESSQPERGLLISQPFTFTKGAVVAERELPQFAVVAALDHRNWTRGRYTLTVQMQPIDGASTNVSVNVRIEGRSETALGAEWLPLKSNGRAEQQFLAVLIEKVIGAPPSG